MPRSDTPNEPARSLSPDDLLARLSADAIPVVVHHHAAVFTVAESADIKADMPGGHTKNLFLKDRAGRILLLSAEHATSVDLKALGRHLGVSGRLSFGSLDLLREVLGVEPGSVTPLAAVNDRDGRVEVLIDAALLRHGQVNVHPLVNTMTVGLSPVDLLAFLRGTGHAPRILSFGQNCVADASLPS